MTSSTRNSPPLMSNTGTGYPSGRLVELHPDHALLVVDAQRQLHDVARLVRADRDDQLVGIGHRTPVDRDDHVTRPDARAVGRSARRHGRLTVHVAARDLDALA